ncbi:hypothetical protein D0T49_02380 [Paludibacter sp. 221]|nr:hypothetical protein [Paludibacter sp. 221]
MRLKPPKEKTKDIHYRNLFIKLYIQIMSIPLYMRNLFEKQKSAPPKGGGFHPSQNYKLNIKV